MKISCFFCGREAEVDDTEDAHGQGWYTHRLMEPVSTMKHMQTLLAGEVPVHLPASMGFACGHCADRLPRDVGGA